MDCKLFLLLLLFAIIVIELNAQVVVKGRKKSGVRKPKPKITRTKAENDEFKKWKVSKKVHENVHFMSKFSTRQKSKAEN